MSCLGEAATWALALAEWLCTCFLKLLGPILILSLLTLTTIVVYTYFAELFPLLTPLYGQYPVYLLTVFGLFIAFNIVFNYVMIIVRGPGHPPVSSSYPQCSKCHLSKPPRAHHCAVCRLCVLKMDHHCPWVNTCVGHRNHRYFVLFLVYMSLGTIFFTLISLPVTVVNEEGLLNFCFSLCGVMAVILTGFASWHLYLIVKGFTTIEMMQASATRSQPIFDIQRGDWRLNLKLVFGSKNILKALRPSLRELKHDGIHWPEYRLMV